MKKRPPCNRIYGILFRFLSAAAVLFLFPGCNDFFTTSLGKAFASDKDFSSLSFSGLVDAAERYGTKDSEAAKSIMNCLASASKEELLGLSTSEKTAVLNTAANAAYSLDSVLDLIDELKNEDTTEEEVIDKAFELFDSGTNMNAVQILLDNGQTRNEVSVDTLILSSAALMASVDESEIDMIKNAVENKNAEALSGDLKAKAKTVIAVVETLEEREDEVVDLGDSLGFDLSGLLPGYGKNSGTSSSGSGN